VRYLIDTNVLSELVRNPPAPKVIAWVNAQSRVDLCTSVLVFGEITKGIALTTRGRRRDSLRDWATRDLPRIFADRVLSVDHAVATEWGRIAAEAQSKGRPLGTIDGLLLATASVHELTLVTRNERECAGRGVTVLNPWR